MVRHCLSYALAWTWDTVGTHDSCHCHSLLNNKTIQVKKDINKSLLEINLSAQ